MQGTSVIKIETDLCFDSKDDVKEIYLFGILTDEILCNIKLLKETQK